MTPGDRIISEFFGSAIKNDTSFEKEVSSIYNLKSLPDVMIGYQQGNAVITTELLDDLLDVEDRYGIDTTERFVEH